MEQMSQTLRLFETIKLYNQILEKNLTSGIVCGNFLHSMLFYVLQTYKYLGGLCQKWSEKLPYTNLHCQVDWLQWYADFNGMYDKISKHDFHVPGVEDVISEDEISFDEFNSVSDYVFDASDEQDMEVSDRFKSDVLKQLRNIDAAMTDINDYLYLVAYYLKKICLCISKISKILKRPSPDKILAFFDTSVEKYMGNMKKADLDLYLDRKVSVPECELRDFAIRMKQEYWVRLCESKFMDEKMITVYDPRIGGDSNELKLAYKRFLKPDGTLNEDVVSKYIFFNRAKLTDEQINAFFGYYFMMQRIDEDMISVTEDDNGRTMSVGRIAQTGSLTDRQVVQKMLRYVDRLSGLVVPRYAGCMHEIWESMFTDRQLSKAFEPRAKEKSRAGGFSKKFLCNVVSLLWGKGYYRGGRMDFIRLLEDGNANHSIKNYIMRDIVNLSSCVMDERQETIDRYKEFQVIIERILAGIA